MEKYWDDLFDKLESMPQEEFEALLLECDLVSDLEESCGEIPKSMEQDIDFSEEAYEFNESSLANTRVEASFAA